MTDLSGSISNVILLLVGAAIWAVLFVVIIEALKNASPFAGWIRYVIAGCVSLLSVIGMFRMFGGPASPAQGARDEGIPWLILLPYAVVGMAILVVLLLLFLWKLARRRISRLPTPDVRLRKASDEKQHSECPGLPRSSREKQRHRGDAVQRDPTGLCMPAGTVSAWLGGY